MMVYEFCWLFVGVLAAVGYIYLSRFVGPRQERLTFAWGLFIAALLYIVFAFVWGNSNWIGIEVIGVFFYGLLAWLGWRHHPYWLVFGWLLHPIWDIIVHLKGPGQLIVPEWYAIACVSFDLIIAIYILKRVKVIEGELVNR